ncbi:hypothetical protein MmiHf6_12290 [Methanimicrococcus hongohii]|uniref:Uncharacterized protein n=1 Tax=Methanimicrococcus hongohii TaxID=3028295 RepID=A0AA96V057_9EURY|nr:hypothetical protein [Methanimicrococcus sp. Hf6]WNY23906.1 hypothetical protein MmiHf6_12290 [Methanimicrococcus sp. Hf6]
MHAEEASEVFTYLGQAPEPTAEEKKQLDEELELALENLRWHDERIRRGLRLDGTKYEEDEIAEFFRS